jgi:hypothetical protein
MDIQPTMGLGLSANIRLQVIHTFVKDILTCVYCRRYTVPYIL